VGESSAEVVGQGSDRVRRDAVTLDPDYYYYYYEDSGYYTDDDLQFILTEPVFKDGIIRVGVALDKPSSSVYYNFFTIFTLQLSLLLQIFPIGIPGFSSPLWDVDSRGFPRGYHGIPIAHKYKWRATR